MSHAQTSAMQKVWNALRETVQALLGIATVLTILLLLAFLMGGWTRGY